MKGRKRLLALVKRQKGTLRKCRENGDAPRPPLSAPAPATEISARASFWYGVLAGRLQGMKVGSAADSEMAMLCAVRMAEIEECDKEIAIHGRVTIKYETIEVPDQDGKLVTRAQKILKSNPAVAQRSEALRHAQSLLAEFGLSPASRGKVSDAGQGRDSSPWDLLANG